MSDYLQPGLHPDPDSLNAFIEGVLPEHERQECLVHLAECAACREVVYLSQEPLAIPIAAEPVWFWKRWFTWVPALTAVAVAGVLVFSVSLYQRDKSPAFAPPAPLPVVAPEIPTPALPAPPARPKRRTVQPAIQQPETPRATITAGTLALAPPAPVSVQVSRELPVAGRGGRGGGGGASIALARPQAVAAVNGLFGAPPAVTGTITDPAGAALPGAAVQVRPLAGATTGNARTDATGRFNIAGLQPGRYEVQVTAPGFQAATKQINVQPDQIARVDAALAIGQTAETVNVEASVAQIGTESTQVSAAETVLPLNGRAVRALPTLMPTAATAAHGKVMLSADSYGALFRSDNAGKKWKAVKAVWQGKVTGLLALPPTPSGPVFQLTTDAGTNWLSRDGTHWYAAP